MFYIYTFQRAREREIFLRILWNGTLGSYTSQYKRRTFLWNLITSFPNSPHLLRLILHTHITSPLPPLPLENSSIVRFLFLSIPEPIIPQHPIRSTCFIHPLTITCPHPWGTWNGEGGTVLTFQNNVVWHSILSSMGFITMSLDHALLEVGAKRSSMWQGSFRGLGEGIHSAV